MQSLFTNPEKAALNLLTEGGREIIFFPTKSNEKQMRVSFRLIQVIKSTENRIKYPTMTVPAV